MRQHAIRAVAAAALIAGAARAQWTYPGCPALQPSDFKATEIFNRNGSGGAAGNTAINEPVQFALHGVNTGAGALDHVDVYFVQRVGAVMYYDGAAKKVTQIGTIKVHGHQDSGLMGIGLDPGFDANHWVYLWYVPPVTGSVNRHLRLSRFTLNADKTVDMASEKNLLDILGSKTDNWHSGGPMAFDSYGDLWISVGNNSDDVNDNDFNQFSNDSLHSDEWGASNTANLRGGMIRIHPDDSPKGYSIPDGNFGPYWADQFEKQGNKTLADQYRDPKKVLPELYVKGERSNYSIAVHPTKRWAAWGTVNYQSTHDEFNITNHPVFTGFPYFHDNNSLVPGVAQKLGGMDPAHPFNHSPLSTGVKDLPPAVPGAVNNLVNTAIGGPFYVFDPALQSKTKFPPHLHNAWFGFGFKPNQMYLFGFDTTTMQVTSKTRLDNGLFASASFRSPLGAHFGPDGALYILNYDGFYSAVNPGVTRIDYVGSCQVTEVRPQRREEPPFAIDFSPAGLRVREIGEHDFELLGVDGKRLYATKGGPGAAYSFAALQARLGLNGVYLVRVKTQKGLFVRTLSLLL